MVVTIDTNVIYQALRSNSGASNYILKLVRNEQISLAISIPVFEEYQDVLNRKNSLKDLKLAKSEIDIVLQFIALIGVSFNIYFLLRPNLKDENDNIFVELAFCSNSEYLITNNIKDYINSDLKFDTFKVITPSQFMKIWRKLYE